MLQQCINYCNLLLGTYISFIQTYAQYLNKPTPKRLQTLNLLCNCICNSNALKLKLRRRPTFLMSIQALCSHLKL